METRSKGLKEQQQHHKKLLAAMLSQDSFERVNSHIPSVLEEEIEDEDDAMELLGNLTNLNCSQTQAQIYTECHQEWCFFFLSNFIFFITCSHEIMVLMVLPVCL